MLKVKLKLEVMDISQASEYLQSLLNSTLRVHTTDNRMFVGGFKCTDNERNLILSQAYEYRHPSPSAVAAAAAAAELTRKQKETGNKSDSVKVDMTSRFMGLIVVPGQYIVKIEKEG